MKRNASGIGVLAFVIAMVFVVVWVLLGDDTDEPTGIRQPLSTEQRETVRLAAVSGLERDQNVSVVNQLGYTAVSVYQGGENTYFAVFRLCGDRTYQDCEAKVRATADHPVIYLRLTGRPEGANLTFDTGRYMLLFPADGSAIRCYTLEPSTINPQNIRTIYDLFHNLSYSTFLRGKHPQTKPVNGIEWQCEQ